jgi:hypothetical protein
MKSAFSQDVTGQTGVAEQPMAPVFISRTMVGDKAVLVYQLPVNAVNGQPLAPGSYTKLNAYADTKSWVGRLEELVGLEPHTAMIVDQASQAGQNVTIEIPGLAFSTEYHFTACVE